MGGRTRGPKEVHGRRRRRAARQKAAHGLNAVLGRGCASWVAWYTMAARVRVMGGVVHNGGAGARHGCRGTQWRRGCASRVSWYTMAARVRVMGVVVRLYTMAARVRVVGGVAHNGGAGARHGRRGTQWRRGCASRVSWYTMASRVRVLGFVLHNVGAGARQGWRGTQWRRGCASWVHGRRRRRAARQKAAHGPNAVLGRE